jgi:hypothetical protein
MSSASSTTPATPVTHESTGRRVGFVFITAIFALLALNAWGQVAQVVLRRNTMPLALSLLQLVSGAAAYAASVGTFRRRPWAWKAALAWGLITAAMISSLGSLLDLPPEARGGLTLGSLSCLMIGGGLALFLRSVIRAR